LHDTDSNNQDSSHTNALEHLSDWPCSLCLWQAFVYAIFDVGHFGIERESSIADRVYGKSV